MNEALWVDRPGPTLDAPVHEVWRGSPTTLAELRSIRMQMRTLVSGDRPEDAVDRLLLVFEELVSNALRHGAGPVHVAVTAGQSGWLVEVTDAAGDSPPTPAVDRDPALGGLGLYLVAQISAAHGWRPEDDGRKLVWAWVDLADAGGPLPDTAVAGPPAPVRPQVADGAAAARAAAQPPLIARARPRRLSLAVTAVVLILSLLLAWLASAVNASNNRRLLTQQVDQVAALLSTQVAVIQTQMSDAGQVAVATAGRTAPFVRFADSAIAGPGLSLSLWRVVGTGAQPLAMHGPAPLLPADRAAAFVSGVKPTGQLAVEGIVQGKTPRLVYALRPPGPAGLVVYGEVPLNRKVTVPPGGAFSGLDLAAFLGRTTAAEQLVQTTAPLPIRGNTVTTEVPFGDAVFTVVASSRAGLTGPLSSMLPWIVLGVGAVLALAGGAVVETLSRRRAVAEGLALDNQRLYQQQRGIAATLQHALLPDVSQVHGVEVAARYVAGVDELEVGGDWYDVVTAPSGRCVFVVGDISGRGLSAATTMAALRFAARAYVAQGDDIGTVLTRLRGLLDVHVDHQFATVLIGELDPAAGVVRIVSAGHFGPLVLSPAGTRFLDCPVAPPVGVPVSAAPVVTEMRVAGPATLLAFTDGAVERRGEVIDTGLERLRVTAQAAAAQPLPGVLDRLMRIPTDNGGRDDTVILGLRWSSPEG